MRRITIGRGRECDVRLDDSTDMVSRRQAVITVSFFGKMEIYDTGANGTYVNGEKVEKPAPRSVRRGDQVNFAHVTDLDWSKVRDPYRRLKLYGAVLFVSLVAVAGLGFVFADSLRVPGGTEPVQKSPVVPVVDTITQSPGREVAPPFDKGGEPYVGDSRGSRGSARTESTPASVRENADRQEETVAPETLDHMNDPSVDRHLDDK